MSKTKYLTSLLIPTTINILIEVFIIFLFFSNTTLYCQSDKWSEWENQVNTRKIKSILVDGDYLWLATNGGLVKYNKTTGEKIFYNKGNSDIPDNFINGIVKDAKGNIWFTCHFYGIGMFNGSSFTCFNDKNSSIPSIQWNVSIQTDSKGNIWFGSLSNVIKYDGNTWKAWKTGNPLSSSSMVHCVFVDSNDDVWVAGEWGIGIIKDDEFSYFNEISGDLNCIVEDNNGIIWMGGRNKTLIKYNNNQFTNIALISISLNNEIISLAIGHNNELWMGTTEGLLKYSGTGETLYNSLNTGLPNDAILSITADGDFIWIGTNTNGLYKFSNDSISTVVMK